MNIQNSTNTEIANATNTIVATTISQLEATVTEKISQAKFSIQSLVPETYTKQLGFLDTAKVFDNSLLDYSFALLFAFISF